MQSAGDDVYEGFLTHTGFVVPKITLQSRFGARYSDLLNKLTITHYQKVGPPKQAKMYKIETVNGIPCIFLPRTLMKTLLDSKILDKVDVLFAPPRRITAELTIDLYANQRVLIDHLCDNIFTEERRANGSATAILNLRAGMGKTYVAAGVISRLGLRALYIAPRRPLAVQTVKDLRLCFYPEDRAPTAVVGLYSTRGKKSDPSTFTENQSITVIVINSALERDMTFFTGYSCIIIDEVHMYCSDQRREIFRKASSHVVLGMSATTEDRVDGFDRCAHKELAFDGIVRAEEIPGFTYENVVFQCEANIIKYNGPREHTKNLTHESTGRVFTHYMHNQFLSDPYRVQLATNKLIELYDWKDNDGNCHNIYVFAEEIDLLAKAKNALVESLRARRREDIVGDIDFEEGLEMFTGGLKDSKIIGIANSARVLFSTYSYAGTGISIIKMSAILFLTPRKANMKQIIARILRRGSNTAIPRVVVDIVDNKTALKYQAGARKIAYNLYNFKETEIKVNFSDIQLPAA